MKRVFKILLHIIIFGVLTILTQIGGIVYLLSLWINKLFKYDLRSKPLLTFLGLYLISTLLIIPLIAPIFGRERIKHIEKVKPTNYMTVLLNRNYVRPQLNKILKATTSNLKGSNIQINYLDASFPFINKFPLLPHLSHNDGKKLDISLVYENTNGKISNNQKSFSGYGVFEAPRPNEHNQVHKCLESGYFQYDYPKYVTFGSINDELKFSTKGTKRLITSILKNKNLGKLFIEPHLKQRLGLRNNKIRYHGCRAVRHDDHIHIQLK